MTSTGDKGVWVYDLETLINCFVGVFKNVHTKEVKVFSICTGLISGQEVDDGEQLLRFMLSVKYLVGFNNLNFDSRVLSKICSTYEIEATEIYTIAQEVIESDKRKSEGSMPNILELDLYRLHHFDNDAKSTSLKWVQCHLNMPIVEDMPIPHDKVIHTKEELDMILLYCYNDVITTEKLLQTDETKNLLEMRQFINNNDLTNVPQNIVTNMSNASLGEHIILKSLPAKEPLPFTPFYLSKIIEPDVEFKSTAFQGVLTRMKKFKVDGVSKFGIKTRYDGVDYSFGLGGIHAARPGFYKNIKSIDASSYYPRLSVKKGFKPRHFDDTFIRTYDELYSIRKTHPSGSVANATYKEALVCIFGKSNSEYSKLYDPTLTFSITVNGQLYMAMLCEMITSREIGRIVMANTDGIETDIFPGKENDYLEVCKYWERLTGIELEGPTYKEIMIRDVNNYIAIADTGKIKCKGAYEINKPFHKDPSMRVVAQIITRWKDGMYDLEKTDIKDILKVILLTEGLEPFYLYARARTGDFKIVSKNGKDIFEAPRTLRYVITKNGWILQREVGGKFTKIHKDGYITVLNNLETLDIPIEDIKETININWYATEVRKLIISNSSSLF